MNIQENIYIMFPKSKITLINWGENIAHIVTHNNNNNNNYYYYYYYYYYRKKLQLWSFLQKKIDR